MQTGENGETSGRGTHEKNVNLGAPQVQGLIIPNWMQLLDRD